MSQLTEAERLQLEELRGRKAQREANEELANRREIAAGSYHYRSGPEEPWINLKTRSETAALLDLTVRRLDYSSLLTPEGHIIDPHAGHEFDTKNITRESLGRAIMETYE